ncbi:unnamed protein product [Rotaria magnacalcarata]|uniref:Uncharacterized protein n=1 Tax=Rotaria magnacalcarata TaxID=392030 RepID=A0A819TGI0_9BILA|nr:unnamed protein product [Rotaria magnacalcarata]
MHLQPLRLAQHHQPQVPRRLVPVPALAVRQQALRQQVPRRLVRVPALAARQQALRQPHHPIPVRNSGN